MQRMLSEEGNAFSNQSLRRLIIPLIIEQVLAVAVGMADTLMVNGVEQGAVAAVSAVDTINILLINLFSALAAGGAVVAAQYIGRRDYKNANIAAKQLVLSAFTISMVIGLVALVFNGAILHMIYSKLDENVMRNAKIYFTMSALSYPFLGLYNGGVALLRATGDSKTSMYSSLIMNILNVGGNALLIHPLGMGVAGAGLASLISRATAAVIVLYIACRPQHPVHIPHLFKLEFDLPMIKRIFRLGVPGGMENSLFQVGKLLIGAIIASFPTIVQDTNGLMNSVLSIPNIPGSAIGLATITIIGQCLGAGDQRQAKHYSKKLLGLMYLCIFPLNFLMCIFAAPIARMLGVDPSTLDTAITILRVYTIASIFSWPPSFGLPNVLRAAGDVRFTMMTSILSMLLFRLGMSYVLVYVFDMSILGVWIAMLGDWVVRGIFFVWRYLKGKWLTFKVI